jgi:2-desacetyl-2-hydroxyethyl bacteriochlorophyllide A dehydrogenase
MLASVLESPRQVVVSETAPPEPAPGEVVVRLEGAGICASELPVWEGREWFQYPRPPGEPGHEGWGRVVDLGADVQGLRAGDRVAMIAERVHAELAVADARHVVTLPAEIDPAVPFPGEPLACAVNAMRRAVVTPGDRVAVVGCGFLGLLLVQLCAGEGAWVSAVSRRDSGLQLAVAMGAADGWHSDDPELLKQDGSFDVVFEVTGHQDPLDLAARLTRVRGRLMIVGYHQDGRRSVDLQLWNWRGLDVINAHERDPTVYVEGLTAAVQAVAEGRLDPTPLLTHRVSLADIGEAYRVSVERPEGFVKAVWVDG